MFIRRPGEIYVADPEIAKEVLGNETGRYREHSDFFQTRTGMFGPRSAQLEIGREARLLLLRYVQERAGALPALVAERVTASSGPWPDAGNRLLFEHFRGALLGDAPSAALSGTVEQVIERAVLAGARDRHSRLARAWFRARVRRVLAAEIAARRARVQGPPADLLDVVARVGTPSDAELAEVYLSFLFAIVGSVGFLLGWSLYLLGTSDSRAEPVNPAWVVREASRLWPVAWLFGRKPARAHECGGIAVTPADEVVVCGYLVHRDPRHWSDPDEFRPGRWASVSGQRAYLPFGWGPHACTGAGVATRTVEAIVGAITSAHRLEAVAPDPRPQLAAALAPPRFTLRLSEIHRTHRGEVKT